MHGFYVHMALSCVGAAVQCFQWACVPVAMENKRPELSTRVLLCAPQGEGWCICNPTLLLTELILAASLFLQRMIQADSLGPLFRSSPTCPLLATALQQPQASWAGSLNLSLSYPLPTLANSAPLSPPFTGSQLSLKSGTRAFSPALQPHSSSPLVLLPCLRHSVWFCQVWDRKKWQAGL